MNTARRGLRGCGTQTLAVAFGGGPGGTAVSATELWNGTSWTSNPNGLGTARIYLAGAGTQAAGLAFGGSATTPNSGLSATEAFTGPSTTLNYKTLTTS